MTNNHDAPSPVSARAFRPEMRDRSRRLLQSVRLAFRRNPVGVLGLFLVLGLVLVAIFAPQIATHDPIQVNVSERKQPPNASYLFGTDPMGRDIFSRVVWGSRISLRVAAQVLIIAMAIGVTLGVVAGYFGGLMDEVLMRITDTMLAFPSLILALAVNAALGPGINSAVLAVGFSLWTQYARMIRGQVMTAKHNLYVEAAHSIGASDLRIMVRHILPNSISPTVVQMTLDAGNIVLMFASLSFLGLGAQPPAPEWGFMVSEGRKHILVAWWYALFPGLAICALVVGFNLLGDWLRDFLDPRLRGIGV